MAHFVTGPIACRPMLGTSRPSGIFDEYADKDDGVRIAESLLVGKRAPGCEGECVPDSCSCALCPPPAQAAAGHEDILDRVQVAIEIA